MKYTIKNNITKVQRIIAYVLLLSELLTSCGFKEIILPSIQPQDPSTSTCAALPDTSLPASDNTFQLSTTTIEGTALTFSYTPEAGLQANYQDAIMPAAVPVQQYPVIQDVTGVKKPFSQLTKAEAALLASEGKWEANKQGGLSYSGMRGSGGMPGSGAASSSGGGYPSAPLVAAAAASSSAVGPGQCKVEKIVNNKRRRIHGKTSELGERLGNPALLKSKRKLTAEDSLAVISNYLRIGEINAERARGKDLVIFLGNTGAGKSTIINYLYGCEMEEVSREDIGLPGSGSIIRVKGSSLKKELMGIGHHGAKSETFLPEIASDALFTYCDCPGFLDTRGSEISISNAVNIRNAISVASSIKVCFLLTYDSVTNNRAEDIGKMHKILKDLFEDEKSLKKHIRSVLLGITKVPVVGSKSLADLHGAFSEEVIFSSHTDNIVTFDPLENTIAGGLRRQELIDKIKNLEVISDPFNTFKTVLDLDDEQKLREVTENIYKKINVDIESKNYEALCEHLVTLSQINRIPHAYISTVQATVRGILEQYIHDLNHAVTLFSLQEQFVEADRELASLQSLAEHLSKYPGYEFVKKRYEVSESSLGHSRAKSAERHKQLAEMMELKDQLQGLQTQLTQQAEKEAESKAAQVALQTAIEAMSKCHADSIAQLATQQQATQAAFQNKREEADVKGKNKLKRELAAQQAGFAAQKAALEKQQSDVAKAHAAKQAALEVYAEKLAAEKEALLSKEAGLQTAVVTKVAESKLTALRGLLGSNYVGEQAWMQLGIVVTDLPPVSDRMLAEAQHLQRQGEQPLVVLDLGKSIADIERLCTAKPITVLTANGHDAKLRADTCYQAEGAGSRWLLLPGSDHGVLPGSRDKTYADQVQYMESTYPGYAVGGARELVTLAMLKHIQDGTVLFSQRPYTWGRCKDQYTVGEWKGHHICLGGVKPSSSSSFGGLVVPSYIRLVKDTEFGLVCYLG